MTRYLPLVLILPMLLACKEEQAAPPPATPAPGLDLGALPPPPGGEIRGELVLAPAVAPKVAAGDAIYVIARNAATGTAVAVSRLSATGHWPLPFTLSGSHTMTPGAGLYGKVRVEARVDKDGDAMTKSPGDIVGQLADLVEVPKTGVTLTLDAVL